MLDRSLNGRSLNNIAIVDLLPGGFEVVIDSINRSTGHVEYVDVREDRVVVFARLDDEVKDYEYKIKAVNRGSYVIPPVYAESMYDRNLRSKGLMRTVIVE